QRALNTRQLAAMGQITFWALLVYLAFRLGDMAIRHQFTDAFSGRLGAFFAAEIIGGGLVPLVLLSTKSLRERTGVLFLGALLTAAGIVLNRVDVVLTAMDLNGTRPGLVPHSYTPSFIEWAIS